MIAELLQQQQQQYSQILELRQSITGDMFTHRLQCQSVHKLGGHKIFTCVKRINRGIKVDASVFVIETFLGNKVP